MDASKIAGVTRAADGRWLSVDILGAQGQPFTVITGPECQRMQAEIERAGGLPPGVIVTAGVTVDDLGLSPEEADELEAALAEDRAKAWAMPDRFDRLRQK